MINIKEINELKNIIKSQHIAIEESKMCIHNLQIVIDHFEKAKTSEFEILVSQLEKENAMLKESKNELLLLNEEFLVIKY